MLPCSFSTPVAPKFSCLLPHAPGLFHLLATTAVHALPNRTLVGNHHSRPSQAMPCYLFFHACIAASVDWIASEQLPVLQLFAQCSAFDAAP